ncbi:hypothetical protein JNB_15313 [Janibacter sp. HTCC2649]|uniref:hypothetical protein n=1 Tax=Janibacter sp. HTCC2649 TaxID=313589 RepID=UPI000067181D|nr:hypothetical protein [Janibacter sp. HTCC2649]EAP98345.1 hypothetical protein JNB_15313 [Janibacter sp. HTCC2649]
MRRTIAMGAFVIAAMGLGRLITDHVPLEESADKPFVHHAAVDERVALDYADVTVTDVHVTPTIMGSPTASAAGGRWLVVDTELLAGRAPVTMAGFFLIDAKDHRWIPSTRAQECEQSVNLSAGVRAYASFCFDIPKHGLEGARLIATRGPWTSHESEFRRDDLADIDLGIAASEVDGLWALTAAVNVKQSGPLTPQEARR